jgi:hypothetical protein
MAARDRAQRAAGAAGLDAPRASLTLPLYWE